jgi:hypothetical protein
MANTDILKILKTEGVGAWNEFRRRTPQPPSLALVTLDREYLDKADFSACDLANAEFADCSLKYADFDNTELQGASFHKCNLTGATFTAANLERADFYDCDLTNADLSDAIGITASQFDKCSGLDSASFPGGFYETYQDVDADVEVTEEDESDLSTDTLDPGDQQENDEYIEIAGERRKVPKIPRRVPAPIETAWVGDKLTITFEISDSLLSHPIIQANIESFKREARDFSAELRKTNIDARVIDRLERAIHQFPLNATEFSQRIFMVWHQFHPIFEYSKLLKKKRQTISVHASSRWKAISVAY